MQSLRELIAPLSLIYRQALIWFCDHRGEEVDWPRPLPDRLHLVTAATNSSRAPPSALPQPFALSPDPTDKPVASMQNLREVANV